MRAAPWLLLVLAATLACAPLASAKPGEGGQGGAAPPHGSAPAPPPDRGAPEMPHDEPAPQKEERPPPSEPAHDPAPAPAEPPAPSQSGGATGETSAPADASPSEASGRSENSESSARAGPADAGKPEDAGKPDGVGRPEGAGKPEDAGKPDGVGRPEGAGKPEDVGKRDERGRPDDRGRNDTDRGEARGRSEDRPQPDPPAAPLVPAAAIEATSKETPGRGTAVEVRAGERRVEIAQGGVLIAAQDVPAGASTYLVVIHPNGTEEVIADNTTQTEWNTTSYENGFYTVEVRERRADGSVGTLAATRVMVENPRAAPIAAMAAVATGAAVSAGASILASRSVDLLTLGKQLLFDVAGEVSEDKARLRTAERLAIERRVRIRSMILLGASALLLALFKTYADQEGLSAFWAALPVAGLAILCYTVCDYAAEFALARASGARARFRLWGPGAISLAASSVAFHSAFGYPGYVCEDDEGPGLRGKDARAKRMAGVRALAFLCAGIALALPFMLVGMWWRWDFAEYGVGVALMMSAAAAMPFRPLPGKDVWEYSRAAWLAAAVALVALYVAWQAALLPLPALAGLALLAGVAFAGTLAAFRRARAGQHD